MSNDPHPVTSALTPCIDICRLDGRGYCVGCGRSGDEIGRWRGLDDAERLRIMRDVLPARLAGCAAP